MSERYNLLINADRSIIEHSHGANYTTKFQEQVRKKLLDRCFWEIFLADTWGGFVSYDLNRFQDQFFEELKRTHNGELLRKLFSNKINWNKKDGQPSDYYKEEFLGLVKEGIISPSSLAGLKIEWNKKDGQPSDYYKEEILGLVKEGIISLSSLDGLKIEWSKKDGQPSDYYKKELLGPSDNRLNLYYEFLDFIEQEGEQDFLSSVGIKLKNREDAQDIDEYKDEILRLLDEWKILPLARLEIDFNKRGNQESDYYKDELLRLFEEGKIDASILAELKINWNRKDGQESTYYAIKLLEIYAKRHPELRKRFDEIQQSYNPLEEIGLYKQLFFESGPHWKLLKDEKVKSVVGVENVDTIKGSLESQYESKKRFLKSLLVGLYDMGTLQILAESENQKLKKVTGSQVDTYPQDDSLKDVSFVDSLSPKELNVYLLFYINKMTKLNELTIYRRMLGNFTYNEELEEGLRKNKAQIESAENNTSQTPSPEIQKLLRYKREKEAAEDKADNLIAVFNELKAKYDDIVANNMSEKVGQKFPIYMKSFTSFLQHYWEVKDNPDSKQIDGKSVNGQLLEFFELFNSKIEELQRNRY